MILKVMRHSLTNLNESQRIQGQIDIPLSANGEQLAHRIWIDFEFGPFDYIVSSPLLRATQTAIIASKHLNYNKPIVMLQAFIERNFGILDYQPIETSRPLLKHPENIEGFEHNEAFESRITKGLNILHKYYSNQMLLVFCHSHVIKGLLHISSNVEASYIKTKIDHESILVFDYDGKTLNYIERIKKNT